ncbi:MAG: MlaD family protein [Chloroflexota bacterium]|nr:MlaD family protein [Chloroflexota bacterium]
MPRKDRSGASPVVVGSVVLALAVIVTYFGFTKAIPFRHDFRLNAVFETANNLKSGSPVRIAGVTVGEVVKISRYRESDAALVQMELEDTGLPIHEDATAKIRPRIFLEGNFFVDVKPGSPSAPKLEDDDTPLAMTRTSAPVQLDQILTSLQSDPREDLQDLLVNYGSALTGKPTGRQDADQDQDVRGETAARALADTATYSGDALEGAAIVTSAVRGLEPDDLSRLVAGLGRVTAALDRDEGALQGLITSLNTTLGAFAAEQGKLRSSVRELPPTLERADTALDSLNAAFPPTRAFAREILPGIRETPKTIDAAFPFIEQARRLVGPSELGGLVNELAPTTRSLSALIDATVRLLPRVDTVSRCLIRNILPTGEKVIVDGNLTTGVQNYKEFWTTLVALAGESQNFDGNGTYVRLQPGGGLNTISTGRTTLGGDALFGNAISKPLGTRPAFPGRRPPYRPDVPCFTQELPNLDASTGGAERVVGASTVPGGRSAANGEAAVPGVGAQLPEAADPKGHGKASK